MSLHKLGCHENELRPSGLSNVGELPWGAHFCHFYRSTDDVAACLVPYFAVGLEHNEQCLWITSEPLRAGLAWSMLEARVPDLRTRAERKQIQIVDDSDWYRRTGRFDTDAILADWLGEEVRALERGFDGLRLSGDTAWLERDDWKEFVDYEAAVHDAFRNRRVIALCSYALEKFVDDEVSDVLRHHKFAVLHRSGRWETAHSATKLIAALSPHESGRARAPLRDHHVQFYEAPDYLADQVAAYVSTGIRDGEGALVICERGKEALVLEALRGRGIDSQRYREAGQLVMLDARETLARFVVDGAIDRERFAAAVAPVVDKLCATYGSARIYSEMVDVLASEGNEEGILELERLWNEFLADKRASLLCGYDVSHVAESDLLSCISASHGHVHSAESLRELEDETDARRLMGELQHQMHLLQVETKRRRELQLERSGLLKAETRARAQAESASAHLDRLHTTTAALSEAATPRDIAHVVVTEMVNAVSAEQALLAVPAEGGGGLQLLDYTGLGPAFASKFGGPASVPLEETFRTGKALWLMSPAAVAEELAALSAEGTGAFVCLPLALGHRRLGVMGFGYRQPREFAASERALLFDLTKQASLALDRSMLLERAEQENRSKDEFLAILSHELRNPLAALMSAMEIMNMEDDQATFARGMLERQLGQLKRLVDALLDVSRLTRGKIELRKEVVDLKAILNSAVDSIREQTKHLGHELRLALPTEPIHVEADPVRLHQVFGNLLDNAAKYSDAGGQIDLSVEVGNAEVTVRCRDRGWGIEREMLPRIFEPFAQMHATLDRGNAGLGIGLTLVHRLVEKHGGSVAVRSEGKGKGSEFIVTLPRLRAHEPSTRARAEESSHSEERADPLTILLIDDNRDFAESTALLLGNAGHSTVLAHDGEEGIRIARRTKPDLALIDIGLPGLDGFEVARRLRDLEELADTILVAVSGYSPKDNEIGDFDEYLVKPVESQHLLSLIQSLSTRKSRTAPRDA